MNVFSVVSSHEEVDPCFITKLASNTEVVGALVSSVESRIRIFRKDLVENRTLTSTNNISDICFFPSSSSGLVSSTLDGLVQVWDLRTSEPVRSIRIDEEEITSIAVGAKDDVIATAVGSDVVLTDIGTSKTLHRVQDHSNDITALGFHPIQQNFLFSAAEDGLCVIRDVEKVEEIRPFCIDEAPRSFTFVGPDRSLVCFLGHSEELSTFSVADAEFGTKVVSSDHARRSPLLCDGDSGGYLVSAFYEDWMDNVLTLGGSSSGELLLFESSKVRASFAPCHTGVVRSALSIDARIFTCGEDGMVVLWRCEEDSAQQLQLQSTVHKPYRCDRVNAAAKRRTPY